MRHISTALTLFLFVGCTTKEDDDSGFDFDEVDAGTNDGGTADGETTGGGTTDGGATDGSEEDGSEEDGGTTEGGGEDGGEEDGGSDDGGSDDGSATGSEESIAIAGNYWNATLSASYTITDDNFTEINSPPSATTYTWPLSTYSNEDRYAIGETPAEYWSGGGWARFDWVIEDGTVHLCMTVTDAESEAAALATEAADPSDLDDGCANLVGWMPLTPA